MWIEQSQNQHNGQGLALQGRPLSCAHSERRGVATSSHAQERGGMVLHPQRGRAGWDLRAVPPKRLPSVSLEHLQIRSASDDQKIQPGVMVCHIVQGGILSSIQAEPTFAVLSRITALF